MSLQRYIYYFLEFLNNAIIPLIIAVAFVYFLWNIVNYFFIKKDYERGRDAALYGIGAFVLIVSLWGIVNLLVAGLDFNREGAIVPDYICEQTGNCSFNTPSSGGSNFGSGFSNSSGGSCTLGVFCSYNDRGVRTCEWCAMVDI